MNGGFKTNADERWMELAAQYAEGAATADEVRELEAALRADAELRRRFLRYMNIDAALGSALMAVRETEGQSPASHAGSFGPGSPALRRRGIAWKFAAVAAAAAVLVFFVRPLHLGTRNEVSPERPSTPSVAAASPAVVLTAATDARWADPDVELSLRSGEAPAGLLRLEAGVAEFRLAGGATVVLLGPAAVRFPAANRLFLQEGKVLCRCPTPESRVTLTTPATQVEDLGTEFAVDASSEAGTRVAVVSGRVRVGTAQPRLLQKNQSAVVGPDKVVRIEPLPPDAFADLFRSDPSHQSAEPAGGNRLADAAFAGLSSGKPWQGTEGYVEPLSSVSGGSAAVHARSHRLWPGVRQTVETGDVSGRLLVASVIGTTPAQDPMCERQSAILKVAFLDADGREFASASRHFLQAGGTPGAPVAGRVAAYAPAGTRKVQLQLLLSARGQATGTVVFSKPGLFVGNGPGTRP